MKESDMNRKIVSTYNNNGMWAYKIPDPPQVVATSSNKRPFDLFGICDEYSFYFECKLLKNKYQSFNFKRFEEHQIDSLKRIKDKNFMLNNKLLTLLVIGIWESRNRFSGGCDWNTI